MSGTDVPHKAPAAIVKYSGGGEIRIAIDGDVERLGRALLQQRVNMLDRDLRPVLRDICATITERQIEARIISPRRFNLTVVDVDLKVEIGLKMGVYSISPRLLYFLVLRRFTNYLFDAQRRDFEDLLGVSLDDIPAALRQQLHDMLGANDASQIRFTRIKTDNTHANDLYELLRNGGSFENVLALLLGRH